MFPNNTIGGSGVNIDVISSGMDRTKSHLQKSSQPNVPQSIQRKPKVKIVEQPASKTLRFRYLSEGKSAGSIPGVHSTPHNNTFPTIEIVDYVGPAIVVVSCVTKDPPYRPHPHNLVGKDGCKKGVCTMEISRETMRAVFTHLGIQCVTKKDIENALTIREAIRVDPFKTGFDHKTNPSTIDLSCVRLCFQVFLDNEGKGHFALPLTPVVSDPIYDKKSMCDLLISRLCCCSSTVVGGKEIILLCEKVFKEDISVRFFEELDGQVIWEAYGDFQLSDVHKQAAITFKTPQYKTLHIEHPVNVNIQLKRPSDGETSAPLPFVYVPLNSDPEILKRKRTLMNGEARIRLENYYRQNVQIDETPVPGSSTALRINCNVKTEPNAIFPNLHFSNKPNQNDMQDQSTSSQLLSSQYNPMFNIPPSSNNNQHYQQQRIMFSNHEYNGNICPNIIDLAQQSYHQQQQSYQASKLVFGPIQSSFTALGAHAPGNNNNGPYHEHMNNKNDTVQQQQNQFNQHWHLIGKNNLSRPSHLNKLNNFKLQDNQILENNFIANNNNNSNNLNRSNRNQDIQKVNQNYSFNSLVNCVSDGVSNVGESSLLNMDSEQLMQLNSAELSVLSIN